MAGGTARVPGLLDLLKEEFAMPVEELYPLPQDHHRSQPVTMKTSFANLAPRLAIAVGLALRSFDNP